MVKDGKDVYTDKVGTRAIEPGICSALLQSTTDELNL